MSKLDEVETVTMIELPTFDTFKSTRQDTSPYELFHFWVASEIGGKRKNKSINVTASMLHPKDAARLDRRQLTWLKKVNPGASKHWLRNALMMYRLDTGPASCTIKDLPTGVQPGFVYVDKKRLYGESDGN